MNNLFRSSKEEAIPHVSNKAFSMGCITNGSRPDYIVEVYDNETNRYTNIIGEIKTKETRQKGITVDLYRIAIFCKEAMDKHNLDTVMGFQAVGKN
ncbi:hypothetical protein BCV72DRAFT_325130 [Rhizopus microsporus var. microsporus]|uniref:Uncharacterized protein n=1 Tax=Rhizopus microsporus var. microsporus TaxID=86635 RepID=A0A1X0QM01_RHIZD|nr:hypothetical protein BCV72DRAFT_325130 [Rhizopus microsporus var. microsporus]